MNKRAAKEATTTTLFVWSAVLAGFALAGVLYGAIAVGEYIGGPAAGVVAAMLLLLLVVPVVVATIVYVAENY